MFRVNSGNRTSGKAVALVVVLCMIIISVSPVFAQEDEKLVGATDDGGVASVDAEGVLHMDELIIEGRLERPVGLFLKRQEPDFKAVHFTRDFWDDILTPLDKEEFEKKVKETKFDMVKNPLLWLAVTSTAVSGAAAGYQWYNQSQDGSRASGQALRYTIVFGISAAAVGALYLFDVGGLE